MAPWKGEATNSNFIPLRSLDLPQINCRISLALRLEDLLSKLFKDQKPIDFAVGSRSFLQQFRPIFSSSRGAEIEVRGRQHAINRSGAWQRATDRQLTNEFLALTP